MFAPKLRRRRGGGSSPRRLRALEGPGWPLPLSPAPGIGSAFARGALAPPTPLAARGFGGRLCRRRAPFDQRRVEIDAGLSRELCAQLVAQDPGAHFRHLALGEIAEFEGAEGNADEAVDRKPQVLEHLLDLAVLALAQAHGDPGVRALLAVELRLDGRIVDAVEADPAAERIELRLVDGPVDADAIAAEPPGRRQLQDPRQAAVVGQEKQALGVDVETADRDDTRQVGRQGVENRRPPLGIARRGDESAGFVEEKEPRALGRAEPLAVDPDVVDVADVIGGALEHLPVDADAARRDPGLGVAARAEPRAGHHLGDAAPLADLRT